MEEQGYHCHSNTNHGYLLELNIKKVKLSNIGELVILSRRNRS